MPEPFQEKPKAGSPGKLESIVTRIATDNVSLCKVETVLRNLGEKEGSQDCRDLTPILLQALKPIDFSRKNIPLRFGSLVAESPAINKLLERILVEKACSTGVWREIRDFPQISGLVPMVLAIVFSGRSHPGTSDLVQAFSKWSLEPSARQCSASDAFLLAELFTAEDLDWLQGLFSDQDLKDVFAFARWLSPLLKGGPMSACPSSQVAIGFFETRGFRGPRRRWARDRGRVAGRARNEEIDSWVLPAKLPGKSSPIAGQAAMLTEWFVSFQTEFVRPFQMNDPSRFVPIIQSVHKVVLHNLGENNETESYRTWATNCFRKLLQRIDLSEEKGIGWKPVENNIMGEG